MTAANVYVVDYVEADGGNVYFGEDGRTALTERHPGDFTNNFGVPAKRPEPRKHYNHLPANFRFMDHCNERARDGWRLVSVAHELIPHSYGSKTQGLWLFFERPEAT
jgi:hypothetical protein